MKKAPVIINCYERIIKTHNFWFKQTQNTEESRFSVK